MLYLCHATARLPAATGTAFMAVALALVCMASPAHCAEAPVKPATDAAVRIKAFPPSNQVDSTTTGQKDTAAAGSEDKSGDEPRAHGSARIQIDGGNDDFDFDAFNNGMKKMPWAIGLIFLVVSSIFLTPVILLIGIIWYKLRKTRLQNEAMLALAAKGVVPAAVAADALAASASPVSVAPQVYQQALAQRKRVIWSDLRKGVILSMIGLAFLLYGITNSGEPSWVGLVLLFVGIGYIVLWWMEGRHLQQTSSAGPASEAGSGPGGG